MYLGPIAAGEAVVADNAGRIATQLRRHYGDALAIEMEGRGFLEAAHIDSGCRAVVVRGISDLLTGKSEADAIGWQYRAADAAASFFFEMLALEAVSQSDRNHPVGVHSRSEQPEAYPERHLVLGRAHEFHKQRVQEIAGPTPRIPVLDGARLVMHLIPLPSFDIPQPAAFSEICRNPKRFPPILDTAPRHWKISFDGLVTGSNGDGLTKPQRAYVYVFRSGAVEAVVSNIARGHNHDALQLPNIQSMVIHYARVYGAALRDFGIHPPLAILVSLARVKNMRLLQDFIGNAIMEDIPCAWLSADTLEFGDAIFEATPDTDNISAKMLYPILSHMANTAGLATPPYFDSDGNYTLTVACPAG